MDLCTHCGIEKDVGECDVCSTNVCEHCTILNTPCRFFYCYSCEQDLNIEQCAGFDECDRLGVRPQCKTCLCKEFTRCAHSGCNAFSPLSDSETCDTCGEAVCQIDCECDCDCEDCDYCGDDGEISECGQCDVRVCDGCMSTCGSCNMHVCPECFTTATSLCDNCTTAQDEAAPELEKPEAKPEAKKEVIDLSGDSDPDSDDDENDHSKYTLELLLNDHYNTMSDTSKSIFLKRVAEFANSIVQEYPAAPAKHKRKNSHAALAEHEQTQASKRAKLS